MRKAVILALIILFESSTINAARIDENPIETKTREVAKTLRCAVCQSESVWESNATLAKQMLAIIRERVAQGESPEEIRTYFVGRYGDYILLKPRKRGMNWILWAGPFVLLAIGGGALFITLRRWVAQTTPLEPEDLSPLSDSERNRIEQERHSLEE